MHACASDLEPAPAEPHPALTAPPSPARAALRCPRAAEQGDSVQPGQDVLCAALGRSWTPPRPR